MTSIYDKNVKFCKKHTMHLFTDKCLYCESEKESIKTVKKMIDKKCEKCNIILKQSAHDENEAVICVNCFGKGFVL